MIERSGRLLSVAALARAIGMPKASLYNRIRRRSDLTGEQSEALGKVLASVGLRLLPDHAATAAALIDGPPAVTLVALRRASQVVALGPLSLQIGKSSTMLRSRLRNARTEFTEAESAAIVGALADAGVEFVSDPSATESTRARWTQEASVTWLRAGGGRDWTPADIQELRVCLGLTQRAMAHAMGFKAAHSMMNLEHGTTAPSGPVLRVLDYLATYGVLAQGGVRESR